MTPKKGFILFQTKLLILFALLLASNDSVLNKNLKFEKQNGFKVLKDNKTFDLWGTMSCFKFYTFLGSRILKVEWQSKTNVTFNKKSCHRLKLLYSLFGKNESLRTAKKIFFRQTRKRIFAKSFLLKTNRSHNSQKDNEKDKHELNISKINSRRQKIQKNHEKILQSTQKPHKQETRAGIKQRKRSSNNRAVDDSFKKNNLKLMYEVLEEKPVNTFIGNVKLDLQEQILRPRKNFQLQNESEKDSKNNISNKPNNNLKNKTLNFKFISDSVPLFKIDSKSGIITTSQVIDRDRDGFCRRKIVCQIDTSLAILENTVLIKIVKVIVDIIDINDNGPRFVSKAVFYE